MTDDVLERGGSIEFPPFRLDMRGGQLTRSGTVVPLRPKTWAVLIYLAERPGVLVTKDELLDAVWHDVAVTPDTLTKSIGELRLALGDSARTPHFIETVHRRGFRFVDPASRQTDADVSSTSDDAPASTPFVGRSAELRRLRELFNKAQAGARQVVFITGAAGVGKTRLIETFLASNAIVGCRSSVWIGRGGSVEQYGTREAYMPVLEALGRLAQRQEGDDLVTLLRRAAPTWLAQMPWLMGEDDEGLQRAVHAARAERMLREFAILIEELTADVTVVLVLEDLHWSDPSTVDLLSLLAQRAEPARFLVLATYRPADTAVHDHGLAQAVRALRVRRQCVELPLHDLTEEDVANYLRARFPGAEIPATLAQVIHSHTDGNPLFVGAVVQHLLSRGWILETAPGWSFTTDPERMDLGLPDDALRMIETQFESLSPADRRLVETASIAGRAFSAQVLAAVMGGDADEIEQQCESLARSQRFLDVVGSGDYSEDDRLVSRYQFAHELYRRGVYAQIPEGQRRRLHHRIGEVLEGIHGERAGEIAPDLAVHFEQGGNPARAVRYLAAAAARASRRFAGREAIAHLEAAIALVAQVRDIDEQHRHELDLRLALAPKLNELCGFASDEVLENCERAYELCAGVGTPEQLFQTLYALCHVHAVRADKDLTPAALQQLEDLAQRIGTPGARLLTDTVRARTAALQGRFGEVGRIIDGPLWAGLESGGAGNATSYGADPVLGTKNHHAFALWFLGFRDRAKNTMRASLVAATRLGVSPFTQAATLAFAAVIEMLCRDAAAVDQIADQLRLIADEHGFRHWGAMAAALAGWARVQQGELREGIDALERALADYLGTGARVFSTHILAFLTEARLRAGEIPAALDAVEQGLQIAETTTDRSYWPELWRLKGELLLAAAGRPQRVARRSTPTAKTQSSDAEPYLLRALELARQMESKSLELRAATSLARAWYASGRRRDASQLLSGICKWFGEDAENRDLADARALLDRLSPPAPPPAPHTRRGALRRATKAASVSTHARVRSGEPG